MLQLRPPAADRSEVGAPGTRSGTGLMGCHTTLAVTRLDGFGLLSRADHSTTVNTAIEFKNDDESSSFRARGRERASAQRNR